MQIVYFETVGDRHLTKVGGLTVLERRIREVAKRGATHVLVAAERVDFGRPLPVVLEFVSRTSTIPEGVKVERADVLDGVEITDHAAAVRAEQALLAAVHDDEGLVDARIRRPIAMRLARVLARRSLALTPRAVALVAVMLGLIAAIVVLRGGWLAVAIGGVMLEVSAIVEASVGRLARLRFQRVKHRAAMRAVVDCAFVLAIGVTLGGRWWWMALGAAAIMPLRAPRPGRLRALGQRDQFGFFAMVSCVIGVPEWVVIDALVVAAVNLISLVHRRMT